MSGAVISPKPRLDIDVHHFVGVDLENWLMEGRT
jgi:hypothetical protein